ncbi:MAG: NADH-quinone oxidoreductase subunit N [Acidobacteria bacterium]|nr:MAG: NADH-quinone oxidoreductase subunit N [Acidobacteriota bacterium]
MNIMLLMQAKPDWQVLAQDAARLLMPEMLVVLFACFVLVLEFMLTPEQRRWAAYLSLAGLGAAGLSLALMFATFTTAEVGFYEMYVVDEFALVFKVIFLLAAIFTIALSIKFLDVENEQRGEYYSLILFATAGMMFMASGADLLSIFISFELMALTTYILVAYLKRDRRSNEAAMKYFLLGIFSSGIFLYGMSLIYGLTAETNLTKIADALARLARQQAPQATGFVAMAGMIFIAAAMFFKIAAVPFHMWCPDAYEGAPTSVTAFMSVGPKAAAFAIFARIFIDGLPSLRGDLAGGSFGWVGLLAIVSALTMTWGNIAALTQSSAKRLMAYSSISHAGYLLLGLIAGNETGYIGLVIYLFVYVFMNLGAWGVIVAQRRATILGERVDDFNGLIHRSPGMAVMMTIFLLSLTGIPPTAGFVGKYFLFAGLIETGNAWLIALCVLAVINTAISLYYYARFIKAMFMSDVKEEEPLALSTSLQATLVTATVMVLAVGVYPKPFIAFTESAARHLLGL